MKCYIIDDEPYAIDTLTGYINGISGMSVLGTTTDSLTALSEIQHLHDLDVIFLDIDMPQLSGIELAKLLPKSISVIFTTAHAQYAVDGFDLEIADFLLKPISLYRFLQAVDKIKKSMTSDTMNRTEFPEALFINPGVKGKSIQIALNDIIYIEGLKNYITIHAISQRKITTYLTMSEIQASLPENRFWRVHKSFIINKNKIDIVEGNSIIMNANAIVPIGISYRDHIMNHIALTTLRSKRGTHGRI